MDRVGNRQAGTVVDVLEIGKRGLNSDSRHRNRAEGVA